jgi:hypothetical protein
MFIRGQHAQVELLGVLGIPQFFQGRFFLTDDQDPLVEIFGLAADQGFPGRRKRFKMGEEGLNEG